MLKSVEQYLTSFQNDLGAVSAEIEKLQNRSAILNTRLNNRQSVERLLGPAVERVTLSPALVRQICDGPVDEHWATNLAEVERRFEMIETASKAGDEVKALDDMRPLFANLINKVTVILLDELLIR